MVVEYNSKTGERENSVHQILTNNDNVTKKSSDTTYGYQVIDDSGTVIP